MGSTVNAPNSDAPSSGQALISEQFLGDQIFYLVKIGKKLSVVDIPSSAHKFSERLRDFCYFLQK